jgi:hypothetical protein
MKSIVGAASAAILVVLRRISAAMLLVASTAALAHHSPAVFDHNRQITIVGIVAEFHWGNPHCWIRLDVTDAAGATTTWGVEMNPANSLARNGWTSRTVQPGDKIEVKVYPLRNDEKGGQYISLKLPDGTTMDENTRELQVIRP